MPILNVDVCTSLVVAQGQDALTTEKAAVGISDFDTKHLISWPPSTQNSRETWPCCRMARGTFLTIIRWPPEEPRLPDVAKKFFEFKENITRVIAKQAHNLQRNQKVYVFKHVEMFFKRRCQSLSFSFSLKIRVKQERGNVSSFSHADGGHASSRQKHLDSSILLPPL